MRLASEIVSGRGSGLWDCIFTLWDLMPSLGKLSLSTGHPAGIPELLDGMVVPPQHPHTVEWGVEPLLTQRGFSQVNLTSHFSFTFPLFLFFPTGARVGCHSDHLSRFMKVIHILASCQLTAAFLQFHMHDSL